MFFFLQEIILSAAMIDLQDIVLYNRKGQKRLNKRGLLEFWLSLCQFRSLPLSFSHFPFHFVSLSFFHSLTHPRLLILYLSISLSRNNNFLIPWITQSFITFLFHSRTYSHFPLINIFPFTQSYHFSLFLPN